MDLLYMNDRNNDLSLYYDQETFKAIEAFSPRPHVDEPEDIDRSLAENKEEVWEMVRDPKTYVYVSGLSRLEETLDTVLSGMAGSEEKWEEMKKQMAAQGRWSTLFYE